MAPTIDAVLGLPISIGWGGDVDLRKLQRRTSDLLIEATGGRAVIAEELVEGEDEAAVTAALRALGEDPARTLAFALTVTTGGRLMAGTSAIPGFLVGKHVVVDYHAHIEVRHVGSKQVLGSVETVASGMPQRGGGGGQGAEGRRAGGDRLGGRKGAGRLRAATDAGRASVSTSWRSPFRGRQRDPAADAAGDGLSRADRSSRCRRSHRAASGSSSWSRASWPRSAWRPATCWACPGGHTAATRAALARALSRGLQPQLAIERAGQQYILAATASQPPVGSAVARR